jgi:A/G-specific adenine glycosylase
MILSPQKIKTFQDVIWSFYKNEKRHFPWRTTKIPYRILVSEIMLQQTQTERVREYYRRFLRKFPTLKALSRAKLAEVLIVWQGLGYNRRARFLWQLAQEVVKSHKGRLPSKPEILITLPGIGSYTAQAISVFAHNQPCPLIETNIRSLYIDYFFADQRIVKDSEVLPLVVATIDHQNPREWFYALMDYGSKLKKNNKSVNARSAHYVRQLPFEGSRRQLRGLIIRELSKERFLKVKKILLKTKKDRLEVESVINDLQKEGLIQKSRNRICLTQ